VLPQSEKDQIVHEFCEATSNASLKRDACSFCGKFENAIHIKMKSVAELDISLLDTAVRELRIISRQH
jgi:hypothetical protein